MLPIECCARAEVGRARASASSAMATTDRRDELILKVRALVGTFSIDVDIGRNARDVLAVLSDVRRMPLWYEAVKEVIALTPGVSGLGARYEIGRSLPGGA